MDQGKALPPDQNEGLELDAIIAVLLGWSEFHYETHWHEHPDSGSYQETRLEGRRPGEKYNDAPVPKFSTSVDDALTLIPERDIAITLNKGSGWVFGGGTKKPLPSEDRWICQVHTSHASAPTPALAICRAWLSWKNAQKAQPNA